MNNQRNKSLKLWRAGAWQSAAAMLLTAAMFAGCARFRDQSDSQGMGGAFLPPMPPSFENGPAVVLLTNIAGFIGKVVLANGGNLDLEPPVSGQLFVGGDKLLFAPEVSGSKKKRARAGGYSFIWDAAENRGYVLSEALQGYAPVSSNRSVSNIISRVVTLSVDNVDGHRCEQQEVTVLSSDGSKAVFDVWRATDLKGVPVQITGIMNGNPFKLSLSKIRLEIPPADVFVPPEAFTRYESAEALLNELLLRQHNIRVPASRETDEDQLMGNPPPRRQQ